MCPYLFTQWDVSCLCAEKANIWSCVQLWLTSDKFSSKHFTTKLFTPCFLLLFIALKFMIWNNSSASLQYLECALNLLKPNCTVLTINWPMAYCKIYHYHFNSKIVSETWSLLCTEVCKQNSRFSFIHCVVCDKIRKSIGSASNVSSQLMLCTAHHFGGRIDFYRCCLNIIIRAVLSFVCACCCDLRFSFSLDRFKIRKIFTVLKRLNSMPSICWFIPFHSAEGIIYDILITKLDIRILHVCVFCSICIALVVLVFWGGSRPFRVYNVSTRT